MLKTLKPGIGYINEQKQNSNFNINWDSVIYTDNILPCLLAPVSWWDWFSCLFIPAIMFYIIGGIVFSLIKKK